MQPPTSFVGRREVSDQLESLIDGQPLVTLVGAGGIGKTRLATNVAERRTESGHGAVVVELGPALPGDDLELTLARQLGQASVDTFVVGLDGASTLVVLDNCEHVLTDAATLAGKLIEHANLRVLATSRAPLSVMGEHVVALGPLATSQESDAGSSAAVELFLDRATTAGASWLRIPEQQAAVAEIVRHLDGVPLAIELAAARSRVVGPTDMLKLLPRQLDLLDGDGSRTPTDRRSVRGAVSGSYEPLDPDCQRLFRALSLVPHGTDLELSQALNGDDDQLATLELLTRLVDQSLVYTVPGPTGDLVYRLLEPVRAFGLEQLQLADEHDDVRHRYVDAVCAFAQEIVVATATSFSGRLLDQIAQRYTHLLQAIGIAIDIDEEPGRAYQLLLPLYAPTNAPRREQAILAAKVRQRWPDVPDRFRAAAYAIMGHIALWAGGEDPTPHAREALDDPGSTRIARIIAYRVLAFAACHSGDRDQARSHVESALEIAASIGGSFERELKMSWAALVDAPGDIPRAIEQARAMSLVASEAGESVPVVWGASVCVHQHLRCGDLPAARLAAEQAMSFAERATSPWPIGAANRAMAVVCAAEEDWPATSEHLRSSLECTIDAGDIEGITTTVRSAAICARRCDRQDVAKELWQSVPTRLRPSTLPPVFSETERELMGEFGEPMPMAIADAVHAARRALAGGPSVTEERSEAGGASGGDGRSAGGRAVYGFNGYELDLDRHELRRDGSTIHIEPQVFDVLLRLITDAGVLVSKEQILDDVWGSRFVSGAALTSRIRSARAAVGDDGKAQRVIRTVHGRGFIFVAELDERPAASTGGAGSEETVGG